MCIKYATTCDCMWTFLIWATAAETETAGAVVQQVQVVDFHFYGQRGNIHKYVDWGYCWFCHGKKSVSAWINAVSVKFCVIVAAAPWF